MAHYRNIATRTRMYRASRPPWPVTRLVECANDSELSWKRAFYIKREIPCGSLSGEDISRQIDGKGQRQLSGWHAEAEAEA